MSRLTDFGAEHHGLINLAEFQDSKSDRNSVRKARRSGALIPVHQGVCHFAGVPITWEARVLAACWAGGARAVASHRCAAALHELPGGDRDTVEVTCPRWRRTQTDGLIVHENKQWTSRDVTAVNGIPITTPALTLLHLAALVSLSELERAVENALRRHLTTLAELDDLLRRYARRGRPGIRNLRMLVRARMDTQAKPTDSSPEVSMLQLIRRHGLPEPVRQFQVMHQGRKIGRVDLAYPDARIAIEYDSDEFHTGRVASEHDSRRRHTMIAAGWLPITAIKTDLRAGADLFCTALNAALRDRTIHSGVRNTPNADVR